MASVRIIQNSFVGGELSPALYGRNDIEAYFKGAAKLENLIVLKTGGVAKRNGFASRYTFNSTQGTALCGLDMRVVPYRYSRDAGGLLIVSTELATDGVTFQSRATYLPKGTTSGSEYATSKTLNSVLLPGFIYPPSLKWTQVGDTLVLSGEAGAPGSDGTAPTPAVCASVLINHPSGTLTATAYAINSKPAAPYYMGVSAYGDSMLVSDTSSKARTLYYASYTQTDGVLSDPNKMSIANTNAEWPLNCGINVTVKIRQNSSGEWPDEIVIAKKSGALYGELARLQNTDYASSGTDGTGPWRSFTYNDDNEIPGDLIYKQTPIFTEGTQIKAGCSAMFQQRMVFAGLSGEPFSLAFSGTGDFHLFHADRPVANDDPFRITLAADSPATIRYSMAYRDSLLLFTDTGVWRVYGSLTEGFGPNTCRVDRLNDIGCASDIPPVRTTDGIIFVGADKRTVYELLYDMSQDAAAPVERSVLAEHLTEGKKILSITHQRWPNSIIWCALDDGLTLLSFTYLPEHKVYAWSHHVLPSDLKAVQIAAPGCLTDAASDLVLFSETAGTVNAARILFYTSGYLDSPGSGVLNIAATLVTLRPELPQENVQGIPKNVKDCLIRVRNTQRLTVRPNDDTVAAVTSIPNNGDAFTGDIKITPSGLIGDGGQMVLSSASGPCEIQCVVWKTEF